MKDWEAVIHFIEGWINVSASSQIMEKWIDTVNKFLKGKVFNDGGRKMIDKWL